MPQSELKQPRPGISGQTIVNELIRNMEAGRLEMAYGVLLPCIFNVYLNAADHHRLAAVQDLIRDDARRALNARMAEWNRAPVLRRGAERKQCRIARSDWSIEFFADSEGAVPPGDVEIHSELNDTSQPGYRGVKTTLVGREPSVSDERVARDRAATRRQPERVYAEIHFEDDSGPHTYRVTQDEISVGRGGAELWVDLPLHTGDEISREHLRLRRDSATGKFSIIDQSRNGTWVNGRRLKRATEERLPERAEIVLAEMLRLRFEMR
jgi:hypothetical protein